METPAFVLIVAFENAHLLDIAGPFAVFATANRHRQADPPYRLELAAGSSGAVKTSSGLGLVPTCARSVHDIPDEELANLHTLVVVGGEGTREAYEDAKLVGFIARASAAARRTASVCTGAFLLAKAGLLDGKRATTHWGACGALRRTHPKVTVEEDALYVRDGDLWTSAGVTAGMDMTLAMVEEDVGRDAALRIAQAIVMFMMRPGGQSQFSAALEVQAYENGRLGRLLAWIRENPSEDLSIPALAARAHMSERTFARVFVAETGETPARFVEKLRIDLARTALTGTAHSVEQVAAVAGFGTPEQMRRAFRRQLGVAPAEFRARFSAPSEARSIA